jgi:hypothetical protein
VLTADSPAGSWRPGGDARQLAGEVNEPCGDAGRRAHETETRCFWRDFRDTWGT